MGSSAERVDVASKSSVSAIYSDWKDMQKIEQTELREELQNAVWPDF